ncbi:hypothetical protein L9F63_018580, partial [Diploptera punctata]
LLLAVVVHRRKTDDLYKDTDDIRENIINYEDEGGGEGDMTGYDLNVLRLMYDSDGQPILNKEPVKMAPLGRGEEQPDIGRFLDGKKKGCDNDPETNPFDDVRHYAYEGDGNTTGSLSSLASGTDEGDLNFDYLSNFGPRFRKLADMYGEDPSDEEDENFNTPASESWNRTRDTAIYDIAFGFLVLAKSNYPRICFVSSWGERTKEIRLSNDFQQNPPFLLKQIKTFSFLIGEEKSL